MTRAKMGIKINLKQNALSWFKLLSRDSGSHIPCEIHMSMLSQATTRECKCRISYGSLPQRG